MRYINKDGHFIEAIRFDGTLEGAQEIGRYFDVVVVNNNSLPIFSLLRKDEASRVWLGDIIKGEYIARNLATDSFDIISEDDFEARFERIETSDKKSLCDIWTKRDKLNEEFKVYLKAIACEKTPRLSIDKALGCVAPLIEQLLRIRIKLEAIKARDDEIEAAAKEKMDA